MSAFRDKYNVAAVDMRGYGRSDRPLVRYMIACQNPACYGAWKDNVLDHMAPSAKLPPTGQLQLCRQPLTGML